MSITLFGINNCDTVKKARRWLDDHEVKYQFHDVRADGLDPTIVTSWLTQLGCEKVVNKRSTTWKQLDETQRNQLDNKTALALILQHPTLIKRPLLEGDDILEVGFKAELYQSLFNS